MHLDEEIKRVELEVKIHPSPITFIKMIVAYRLAGRDADAARAEADFRKWERLHDERAH
jgi:hypothetical protein